MIPDQAVDLYLVVTLVLGLMAVGAYVADRLSEKFVEWVIRQVLR